MRYVLFALMTAVLGPFAYLGIRTLEWLTARVLTRWDAPPVRLPEAIARPARTLPRSLRATR